MAACEHKQAPLKDNSIHSTELSWGRDAIRYRIASRKSGWHQGLPIEVDGCGGGSIRSSSITNLTAFIHSPAFERAGGRNPAGVR